MLPAIIQAGPCLNRSRVSITSRGGASIQGFTVFTIYVRQNRTFIFQKYNMDSTRMFELCVKVGLQAKMTPATSTDA